MTPDQQPLQELNALLDRVSALSYAKGHNDAINQMASKNTFGAKLVGGLIVYVAVGLAVSYANDALKAYKAKVVAETEQTLREKMKSE